MPTDFEDNDRVRDHLKRAATWAGNEVDFAVRGAVYGGLRETPVESVLEAIAFTWWTASAYATRGVEAPWHLRLRLQQEVAIDETRYRIDFRVDAVLSSSCTLPEAKQAEFVRRYPKIAVELDGHQFHERTPEQVVERNSRDRDLQRAGWTVFHFSYREFDREPQRCVSEVRAMANEAAENLLDALWREVDVREVA